MRWAWGSLALLLLGACWGSEPGIELPDRGGHLSGPVSPPPLHDVVREHASALGIRPHQAEAIQRLADEARSMLDGHHRDIDQAREGLRALLRGDRPDRAAVRKAIRALGAAETRLREGEIGVMLDILTLLDPEQRKALGRTRTQARRPRPPPRDETPGQHGGSKPRRP